MKTTWYWQYFPSVDLWELHTPGYEPECSLTVKRVSPTEQITARHRRTSLPPELLEYLVGQIGALDLWGKADRGILRIEMQADEVKRAAANTRRLSELLAARKKLSEAKIIQE